MLRLSIVATFVNNVCDELITLRNSVYDYDLGSITAMVSTSTIITGCEFRNNHPSSVLGTIIGVYNSGAISIYGTKFISNEVTHSLEAENSVINANNCTFKYNRGSAMSMNYCKVNIVNSVFYNNEARALKS